MFPNRTAHGRTASVHPLVVALAALLPLTAAAQDAPAAKDPVALDTLQVTAQRRVENAKDVPVSISAIQGDKLDVLASGGHDIRFLSGRVPSLNIESSFGRAFPRFYIRGLGNTDFASTPRSRSASSYDDVVQESPHAEGLPAVRHGRVEVAARPAGHPVRPQHPGRRREVRLRQAVAQADGYVKPPTAPTAPSTSRARPTCR
jgi:iron complex outermembrane receptor protein